jgi:hypothetical protein
LHRAGARTDPESGEAARLRMVARPLDAHAGRPGRCRPRGGEAERKEGLQAGRREYIDEMWSRADVELEVDRSCSRQCFGLIQVVHSAAREERRVSRQKPHQAAATTVTHPGIQRLTCSRYSRTPPPRGARDALLWRHSTLPRGGARSRAGARRGQVPWRMISSEECSGILAPASRHSTSRPTSADAFATRSPRPTRPSSQ